RSLPGGHHIPVLEGATGAPLLPHPDRTDIPPAAVWHRSGSPPSRPVCPGILPGYGCPPDIARENTVPVHNNRAPCCQKLPRSVPSFRICAGSFCCPLPLLS